MLSSKPCTASGCARRPSRGSPSNRCACNARAGVRLHPASGVVWVRLCCGIEFVAMTGSRSVFARVGASACSLPCAYFLSFESKQTETGSPCLRLMGTASNRTDHLLIGMASNRTDHLLRSQHFLLPNNVWTPSPEFPPSFPRVSILPAVACRCQSASPRQDSSPTAGNEKLRGESISALESGQACGGQSQSRATPVTVP